MKRREFSKIMAAAGASTLLPWHKLRATPAALGLSDPAIQPKFVNLVPDALAPGFKYEVRNPNKAKFKVAMGQTVQMTGLVGPDGVTPVPTTVWGYGYNNIGYTWPGRTFEVTSGMPIEVTWENKLVDPVTGLPLPHLLPVDTSLHWAYSLPTNLANSIAADGVPCVPHLHGGHTGWQFDGNPEFFFSPGYTAVGPRFVDRKYVYLNDQPAGNLWYHDHALGITRLNVYAGLAGFYFIRDTFDTGLPGNPLGLPAWPYEKAYAIQDRMFRETGELFYPAFPGDPFYEDFITDTVLGGALPDPPFVGGGPTALAEFFGDHMVVNGVIWPKEDVEPRNYRLHLLNGTDSRFMAIQFVEVPAGVTDPNHPSASSPLPFTVIGSDQGLASAATTVSTLIFEPGSRYDIVVNFAAHAGKRIIMKNIAGDAPFNGAFPADPDDNFPNRQTDRVMAFDVVLPLNGAVADAFNPSSIGQYAGNSGTVTRTRKVALFEGMDEYGRLQPLLGTAEPATDYAGNPILHTMGPLAGQQIEGATAWHEPTTENPALGTTEIWEIYNTTPDAHPVHLHLVNFQVLNRQEVTFTVAPQEVVQHNGAIGAGSRITGVTLGAMVDPGSGYVENTPKDMVTALPGQVTRIKATFDKPGRYVWHCHILSHEDHEMMRVLHVGPGA
jgi:spore coat protein A